MSTASATNPRFSTTCRHCGSRVQGSSTVCPHCGKSLAPAFAGARESTGFARAEMPLGDAIGLSRPTPLFMPAGAGAYGEGRKKAPRNTVRQWGLNQDAGIALVIFVLLFGGYALFTQRDNRTKSEETPMHTVIGRVMPGQDSSASASPSHAQGSVEDRAARSATLSKNIPAPSNSPAAPLPEPQQPAASLPVAPTAPAVAEEFPAPAPSAQRHEPAPLARQSPALALNAKSHVPAPAASQQQLAESRRPAQSTIASAAPAPQDHDVTTGDLATARADLEENNLAGAHAALNRALAQGQANSEAFMLRQDLRSREQARDAALNAARACLAQHSWKCAWHNAGNALSIDSSSAEASALEQRSLVDWGASNQSAGANANTGP
jgi:hypothetical protein